MLYDLLIKGGNVLDPGQNLRGKMDIAIAGGKIAAIQVDIAAIEAKQSIDAHGANRYVLPGLIDIHTHIARGATTAGVGLECVEPDLVGVHGGVTTMLDGGSVGIANFGAFPGYILPRTITRLVPFVNIGSYAHTMPGRADVNRFDEIDPVAIANGIQNNPGVIRGIKLRLVGPLMREEGEKLASLSKETAKANNLPLMVHIGNGREVTDMERMQQVTRHMLRILEKGDILTHLCTPNAGGVLDANGKPIPELEEARAKGVHLDAAHGLYNFGFEIAVTQADHGLHPDSIASDITEEGRKDRLHSLEHCMAKFMAIGYTLEDVVRMVTTNGAKALRIDDRVGALKVGYEADLTILDLVTGKWKFFDSLSREFHGDHAFLPIQTIKAGVMYSPEWGPTPRGWLPEQV